jgi:hypothetical protein
MGLLCLGIWLGVATPAGAQDRAYRHPDFNGDGFDDLVVGIPGYDVRDAAGRVTINDAGAVNVFYGSYSGLDIRAVHLLTQDSAIFDVAIAGEAEANDRFGTVVGWGDFNADGFSDLVIGTPDEAIGAAPRAGAVNIIYGSGLGLLGSGNQVWYQGRVANGVAVRGGPEARDLFGSAIATGDFNRDGYDDLAIGAPGEDSGAGAVNVLWGSASGLTTAVAGNAGNQLWDRSLLIGSRRSGDQFGYSLAAADFDDDGDDDLAVGAPYAPANGKPQAGVVNILNGSFSGLTDQDNLELHRDSPGIAGEADSYDHFGYALATGDFKGRGGRRDLVIGVPGDGPDWFSGSIQYVYGSTSGLAGASNSFLHQDSPYVPGGREGFDMFGSTLRVGDFNGDDFDDLAVGVPGEDYNVSNTGGFVVYVGRMGMVNVFYGGFSGFNLSYSQGWDPSDLGDQQEVDGFYGAYLMAGDFNRDGYDDLAIGHPGDDPSLDAESLDVLVVDAGSVDVLRGSSSRLTTRDRQFLVEMAGDLWSFNVERNPQSTSEFGGP